MKLNQITLPSTDIERGSAFYRTLGLVQIVRSPHYARFECANAEATFSLHRVDAVTSSGVVVYFECTDLDARVADLQAQGMVFQQLPTDQPWLWREARLLDPDGNVLCLYFAGANRKHPPWRIAAGQTPRSM